MSSGLKKSMEIMNQKIDMLTQCVGIIAKEVGELKSNNMIELESNDYKYLPEMFEENDKCEIQNSALKDGMPIATIKNNIDKNMSFMDNAIKNMYKASPIGGYFKAVDLKDNNSIIALIGDRDLFVMDSNGNLTPYNMTYPMIIGGPSAPLGVFVPFNINEEGYKFVQGLFNQSWDDFID